MSNNTNSKEEKDYELERMLSKVSELESQVTKMKQVIIDNDLSDELEGIDFISKEEQICIDGINHLAELFKLGSFSKDDAKILDVLHKNLRLARGQSAGSVSKATKNVKADPKELENLFSIVNK